MAYESKTLRRQKIRYNNANANTPLTFQLVANGAKVTPSSANIVIYNPSGTAILTSTAMTVSGTLLTYSVSTTTVATWPIEEGYRAEIDVTVSSTHHYGHIIFDVVKFTLNLGIGRDQLIAMDDNLKASEHGGDEDFSELIEACRDDIQLMLETRSIDNGYLVENMILDQSRLAIVARHYVLSKYWRNKGDRDRAEDYIKDFWMLWKPFLSGIKYDTDQDGLEEDNAGRIDPIRLVM